MGGKKLPVQLILLDDTSTQATAVSLADRLVNSDRGGLPARDLREPPRRGAVHGRGGEPHPVRERRRRRDQDLQARLQVPLRPHLAGRAARHDAHAVGGRAAEGGQAAEARQDRAPLGEHRPREGLPQGRLGLRRQERGRLRDRGGRVVRAEREGLRRPPRQGEGGERGPLPRRRAPARLHHDAPAVRRRRPVPQGRDLRRARRREGRHPGARPREHRVRALRRLVEPAARAEAGAVEGLRRGVQGEVRRTGSRSGSRRSPTSRPGSCSRRSSRRARSIARRSARSSRR